MRQDRTIDSDERLIERTLRGELSAFEQLVERHRGIVFRTAARIVGPNEAEDVSQDAFLRAFHRLDQYRGAAPFRTWLPQIVQNTALNTLARARRGPTDPASEPTDVPDRDPVRQPAAELERRERQARLELKLESFGPNTAAYSCSAISRASATRRSRACWARRSEALRADFTERARS